MQTDPGQTRQDRAVAPSQAAASPSGAAPEASERGAHLEVVDLHKTYGDGNRSVSVLRDVNFTLDQGEMVAIVGASGVGKSTLLHVLGTLDLPSRGTIHFNGEDVTRMGPKRLAAFRNREIGFVFQFHHLLPEFSALENVMMPALIQRVPRHEATAWARDILTRVGLGHRLTHRPAELSGGEQQRVALARAMVLKPSLLLADEPTGNLDRRTSEEMHELFLELNREQGSTLLVVTHNPELAQMMPRCLRMLDGGGLEEQHNRRGQPVAARPVRGDRPGGPDDEPGGEPGREAPAEPGHDPGSKVASDSDSNAIGGSDSAVP